MQNLFADSRLKVDRALVHILELERVFFEHQKNKPPQMTFEPNAVGPNGEHRANLSVKITAPPIMTSAVIGDAIHNLRSSLDLMAVRLVEINNRSAKGVSFPFAEDEASFSEAMKSKNFHRASTWDQAELVRLQPYGGGNYELCALHELDILDKHRKLIPRAAASISTPPVGLKLDEAGNPVGFGIGKLELELKSEDRPKVEYVFPKDEPFGERPILGTLHSLTDLVTTVLDGFEAIDR